MTPVLSVAIRRNALCFLILEDLENTCFVLTGTSGKNTAQGPQMQTQCRPGTNGSCGPGQGAPQTESQFAHNQSQTG